MFKTLLLAYDGSEHSKKAAALAGNVAREQGIRVDLWVVVVMDISQWELGEPYLSQLWEKRAAVGNDLLREAATILGGDIEVHNELLYGSPAESIIEVAKTRGCDLIVMGTRGRGLLEGLLLGSQAEKVISHAICPVLVVK